MIHITNKIIIIFLVPLNLISFTGFQGIEIPENITHRTSTHMFGDMVDEPDNMDQPAMPRIGLQTGKL